MMHVVMAVLSGVAYGLAMWAIVRLLQGSRSRDAIAVAVITGLVVLFVNLLGGALMVVGVLLTTAIAWKALTAVDVTLLVSLLAVLSALASSMLVRVFMP